MHAAMRPYIAAPIERIMLAANITTFSIEGGQDPDGVVLSQAKTPTADIGKEVR
jgi:hypothetical protein